MSQMLGAINTMAPNPFHSPVANDFNAPVHPPTVDYSGANNPFVWSSASQPHTLTMHAILTDAVLVMAIILMAITSVYVIKRILQHR